MRISVSMLICPAPEARLSHFFFALIASMTCMCCMQIACSILSIWIASLHVLHHCFLMICSICMHVCTWR